MVANALNGVLAGFVGEFGGNFPQKNGEKKNPVPQRPPRGSRPILSVVKSSS